MNGGAGNDTIKGAGVMHGDADNDKIYGLGKLYGDAGDDWLEATNVKGQPNGQWYVHLVGGDGWDTLVNAITRPSPAIAIADYSYAGNAISADLSANRVTVSSVDFDELINIHALMATRYDDTLVGSGGNDNLHGGSGNDSIDGGSEGDSLYGEKGQDTLRGDDSGDMLSGGKGNDELWGGGGRNYLYGDEGNDTIHSGGGIDEVYGGAGNDSIYLEGKEVTYAEGKNGNDTFYSSNHVESIVDGGGGADRFVFDKSGSGTYINGFTRGTDKINLSAFNFASFAAVKALASNVDEGVRFELGSDVSFTLTDITLSQLKAADFIL